MFSNMITPEEQTILKQIRAAKAAEQDPRAVADAAIRKLAAKKMADDGLPEAQATVAVLETALGRDLYTVFRSKVDEMTPEQRAALVAEINAAVA